MSLEAWGDDGDADQPYTQERVDEIVQEAIEEIAARLSAMGTGLAPVPSDLCNVPFLSMQKIADWIKTQEI